MGIRYMPSNYNMVGPQKILFLADRTFQSLSQTADSPHRCFLRLSRIIKNHLNYVNLLISHKEKSCGKLVGIQKYFDTL